MNRAEIKNGDQLASLRAAVADGSLPMAALERAVEASLEAEMQKPAERIDAAFVEACEAILWDIYAARNSDCPEHEGQRFAQILSAAKQRRLVPGRRRLALRMIAMVPVVVIGMFVGDVLLGDARITFDSQGNQANIIVQPQESGMVDSGTADDYFLNDQSGWYDENGWYQDEWSQDEWNQEGWQQGEGTDVPIYGSADPSTLPGMYVEDGVTPPLEPWQTPPQTQAPATYEGNVYDPNSDFIQLSTRDLSRVQAVLGMMPPMPSWVPSGWNLLEYNAVRSAGQTMLLAVYETPGENKLLMYDYTFYGSDTSASVAYEQDGAGEWITTPGGRSVYRTTNGDMTVLLWKSGSTTQSLTGPVPVEVLMQMADSIY